MTNLSGTERARYVQNMFTQIAGRYDLMNRLMTGGQDVRWRRQVIQLASLPPGGQLLDLGTGTGDLAREALRQVPTVQVTAADFTLEMMRVGRAHPDPTLPEQAQVIWCNADATCLPFPDQAYDAVVSGFLLRNVIDLPKALAEQLRILRPGGRFVALDTTPPPQNLLAPFIRIHLHTVIPTLGRLITGQAEAYTYLPDSTESFLPPEKLSAALREAGFEQVNYKRLMFGTIAIYWAVRPLTA